MAKSNEPRFAFTARAGDRPPDDQFHTAAEWEKLLAEGARLRGDDPNDDLRVKAWDHTTIWARRNGKA